MNNELPARKRIPNYALLNQEMQKYRMKTEKIISEEEIPKTLYNIIENIRKQLEKIIIGVEELDIQNEHLAIIEYFSIKDGYNYYKNRGNNNPEKYIENFNTPELRSAVIKSISNNSDEAVSNKLKILIYDKVTNRIKSIYGEIINIESTKEKEKINNVLFIKDIDKQNSYKIKITIPYTILVGDLDGNYENIKIRISSDKPPMLLHKNLEKEIQFNITVK